jgi:hypothetical protein
MFGPHSCRKLVNQKVRSTPQLTREEVNLNPMLLQPIHAFRLNPRVRVQGSDKHARNPISVEMQAARAFLCRTYCARLQSGHNGASAQIQAWIDRG